MILEVFFQPYQFCEKKIVLRGGLQQFALVLPIGRGNGYRSHQSGEAKAGIRTGKVLVNLEQGAMKGEVTGAVKHLQTEGSESVLHVQGAGARRKGHWVKPRGSA